MNIFRNIFVMVFILWIVVAFQGCTITSESDSAQGIAPYFEPATSSPKAPDAEGFIQRWLLLEPINKPNRTNTVFTDSYLRETFHAEYFPNQFAVVPKDGDKVTVEDQELAWHALDATGFNVKLFRFASGLDKQKYGVLFWAVTVVHSQREMKNVRMAVGSNSGSMWWLNGKEAVLLTGDRRMVMDDFAIVVICSPIFVPIASSLGFDPLWFALVFILNMQVSLMTPPFGWALIMMKGMAPPEISTRDVWKSVPPFMGIQLLVLIIVMVFPGLAVWLPHVLM